MANRYANLVGSKKISEDFGNINIGFDRVQAEMDTKGTPADAQAKADAAKAAAIATAAEALTAHKARGADEHPTAKGNAAGFMSAADKLKMDASTSAATPDTLMQRDAAGRAKVAAPAAADDIARKAETDAVQGNLESHAEDENIHVTAADHDKLDGIATGAEVNQNAFAVINDVEASSKSDTVIFVGGTGITVTTDPEGKRIVLTATGEATPGAHASSHITGGTDIIPDAVIGGSSGLMSGADAKFVRQDGETKTGAQAKADVAKQAANEYTDQKVGEIVIDDASLTQKGIVQLSNKTDGDAENVAATEKAVKEARVTAISAAGLAADDKYIRKDRPSNQLPNSSGELGLMGWTNLNSASLFTASRGADSLGPCTFVSTQANSIMRSEVFFFQGEATTYTLSADFLNPALAPNQLFVSLKTTSGSLVASIVNDGVTGWHRRAVTFEKPVGVIGVYVEVVVVAGIATAQRRVRRIMLSVGTDGDIWNQDANDSLLFRSASDGKTAVAAAITGKGVAASGSDTFPQLATKIGQISTGPKFASGSGANSSNDRLNFETYGGTAVSRYRIVVNSLTFKPKRIIIWRVNIGNEQYVFNYNAKTISGLYGCVGESRDNASVYTYRVFEYSGSAVGSQAYINDTGFGMPVYNGPEAAYYWEAYG